MGFSFHIPQNYKLDNQPDQIVVSSEQGAVMIFDVDVRKGLDAYEYIQKKWAKEQALKNLERLKVNGMNAATGEFAGNVNGKPVTIRLIVVEWSPNRYFRFQIAIPRGLNSEQLDALKRSTYSLRRLTLDERNTISPKQIKVITASARDTVSSVSKGMAVESYKEPRFRVLNGLSPNATLLAGRRYKVISY
jgi:predicted Zn-dependent protease